MADEFDASGWAQIHQAANRGYLKSIQFFVKDDPSLLELETTDGKNLTPFLCAVDGGKIEAVHQMIELGSKIDAINSQNHGAVEMCALKSYIDLLNYFIEKDFEKIPVWKNLLRFVTSESDEEAEAAGKSLRTLTQGSQADGINPNWKSFYDHGGVPVIIKVAKSSIGEEAKLPAFQTLLNIIEREEVKEQVLSSGGIPTFIKLLKSTNHFLIQLSAEILKEMATVTDYAEAISQNNGIQSLIKVLQTIHNPEVLVQVLDCLGNVAEHDKKYQDLVGQQQGCVQTIVQLLEYEKDKDFLNSACRTVGKVCYNNEANQNSFVDASAIPHVLAVTRLRNKDIQVTAVECIRKVAANNPYSQKQMQTDQVQELLLKLLGTTRSEVVKEKTALALWAIAGREFDVKRLIAERMGVGTLVEFINSMSEDLNFIGSEGLGVLAQGPLSYHSDIANANGIAPLGRLIRSEKEYIVLSVIRAIRFLCLGVGYVPHKKNQNTIMTIRGIKLIVALMVHSRNQMIQVEAALTLASVSLGNQAILDDIHSNIDFSYVRILKMMYSMDPDVRLLAGLALATFAYNNVNQQKEIADQGGVRFNCFCPFLQSEDEYYRCLAAFQVVVLARIIPDEEQALSSAAGIKLLVDLLQDSSNNETLSLAADCIARLAHTRAGVPAAMISINVIEHLCKLLVSTAEQVRGSAAIALGYLSYNHTGERQLLNKCRTDPYLMRILLHYTKRSKISPCFLEAWQHYKKVGLPPIPEGRTNLIGNHPLGMDGNRPVTFLSIDPEGETGSNTRSSTSNIGGEDGRITGRSSRASGSRQATTPRQSGTPLNATTPLNASQISLDSQHSSRSLLPVTAEGNA